MCLEAVDVGIFCGGLGTRLNHPQPKLLVPVRGRPLIEHLLDLLRSAGAGTVRLLTGHLHEQIEQYINQRAADGLLLSCLQPQQGMVASLHHALPSLTSERVLLLNGDTLLTADLCRFVRASAIWPAAVLWTRNAETSFVDNSGFRVLSQAMLQRAAEVKDFENFLATEAHVISMPGQFLDIGTPQRLAQASA